MAIAPNCHILTITGGKGGVGKSIFAANFSLALLMESRKRVLLIDLDQHSAGDQNFILGVPPQKAIKDFCSYTGQINSTSIKNIMNKHPSGLHYVAGVKNPDEKLNANTEAFMRQLSAVSKVFDYIIIDAGWDFSSLQLAPMSESSSIYFITLPEILSVNQTRKAISHISTEMIPTDLFQVVINKFSKTGLNPQAIQGQLKTQVAGAIPQDDITTANALQRSTPFVRPNVNAPIVASYLDLVRRMLSSGRLSKLKALAKPKAPSPNASSIPPTSVSSASNDPKTQLKLAVHNELIHEMDDLDKGVTETGNDPEKERVLKQKTQQVISTIVDRLKPGIDRGERQLIIKEVLDEALGLGPLEDLLKDPNVTEIMVNGPQMIFVEKSGRLSLAKHLNFTSGLHLKNTIQRIVRPLGRKIDEMTPYVDARLKDGSRVNAVIEPVALDGAALTIRKFSDQEITPNHYIQWNSASKQMMDFLKICVENGKNCIVSGGTGSGKTTLLNTLSSFIPATERIITIEDAAELQLKQEHVVRLETKPANREGNGEVSIRDLVRNALRMRPNRIVVGECRGGEALDMLGAMNTGHDGSMTTVHANNPREAITRLETLVMYAGLDLPSKAIREQIAGAVHLIVQIGRLSDGSRKVKMISEVEGIEGDKIILKDIFKFKELYPDKNRKIVGEFQALGQVPSFISDFEKRGIKIPRDIFMPEGKKPKKASGGN